MGRRNTGLPGGCPDSGIQWVQFPFGPFMGVGVLVTWPLLGSTPNHPLYHTFLKTTYLCFFPAMV